ncbi:MAG: hypothetical protein AABN33_23240 [Acidobacteriota bacterium]
MAAPTIGTVRSGSGKLFKVAWSSYDKDVYVDWAGWTYVGKAYSAKEAMTKAEAWLYNK